MTIQRETNSKHLLVVDLEVTYNIGFPIEDDTVTLRCNENALLSVTQLVAVLIYNSCSSVFCNNFGPVKFHLFIITHTQSNTRREKKLVQQASIQQSIDPPTILHCLAI